jgi:hypothetical protein
MKLKDLQRFNTQLLNPHQIAREAKVSYPTVTKYLADNPQEPSLFHVARVLSGMGVDWRTVALGDIIEENGNA